MIIINLFQFEVYPSILLDNQNMGQYQKQHNMRKMNGILLDIILIIIRCDVLNDNHQLSKIIIKPDGLKHYIVRYFSPECHIIPDTTHWS